MHEQGRLYEEPYEQSTEPSGPSEPAEQEEQSDESAQQQLSFEQAFARLEQLVSRLEGGDAGLEDSLRLFEDGVRLARFCRQQLDRAETRIRVLVDGEEGERERQIAAGLEDEIGLGTGDGTA